MLRQHVIGYSAREKGNKTPLHASRLGGVLLCHLTNYFRCAILWVLVRGLSFPEYIKNERSSMNITSSTKPGTEGFNISFSDEMRCGKELLEKLPKGWKVHFSWYQILFSDVQYTMDKKKKTVEVSYNQNLRHWWPHLVAEIQTKLQ